jgi:hypothetical protein
LLAQAVIQILAVVEVVVDIHHHLPLAKMAVQAALVLPLSKSQQHKIR